MNYPHTLSVGKRGGKVCDDLLLDFHWQIEEWRWCVERLRAPTVPGCRSKFSGTISSSVRSQAQEEGTRIAEEGKRFGPDPRHIHRVTLKESGQRLVALLPTNSFILCGDSSSIVVYVQVV